LCGAIQIISSPSMSASHVVWYIIFSAQFAMKSSDHRWRRGSKSHRHV